jgi:hypothetical protein
MSDCSSRSESTQQQQQQIQLALKNEQANNLENEQQEHLQPSQIEEEDGDENDSCYTFKKRAKMCSSLDSDKQTLENLRKNQQQQANDANDEADKASTKCTANTNGNEMPTVKIVNLKHLDQFQPKLELVKPILITNSTNNNNNAVSKQSPVKHRIDAIAANLKALQEQKKSSIERALTAVDNHSLASISPPKVSLVSAKRSQQTTNTTPTITNTNNSNNNNNSTILNQLENKVKLGQKEVAHQLILLRCNKKIELKTTLSTASISHNQQESKDK